MLPAPGPHRRQGTTTPLADDGPAVHIRRRVNPGALSMKAPILAVWSVSVARPCSVQRLPNGHTLVASRLSNVVIEFDRRGEEVWRQRTAGRALRAVRR